MDTPLRNDEVTTNIEVGCTTQLPSLNPLLQSMPSDATTTATEAPRPDNISSLQQYAEHQLDIKVENDSDLNTCKTIELRALRRVARKSVTTYGRSNAQHAELMDSSLWSSLPEELKELIFARVPWPQIYRLRTLSKEMSVGTWFQQTCVKAQPKLFALLSPGSCGASIIVNMFDIKANRWYKYATSMSKYDDNVPVIVSSDGGLVCLASKSEKNPGVFNVLVCNPLSQVWKQLPPLFGNFHRYKPKFMVKLIMDGETEQYRVFVVGPGQEQGTREVHIYYSRTGQWMRQDLNSSGLVLGYRYNFDCERQSPRFGRRFGPCLYNFGNGKLWKTLKPNSISSRYHEDCYIPKLMVKDHLFMVKQGWHPTECWVSEYKAPSSAEASWAHLKDHNNDVQKLPSEYNDSWRWTGIHGCKDFLVLIWTAESEFCSLCRRQEYRRQMLWLYDLCTSEWHELPTMPGGNHLFYAQHEMCELWCGAVP